jgi:hypothetical protein
MATSAGPTTRAAVLSRTRFGTLTPASALYLWRAAEDQ